MEIYRISFYDANDFRGWNKVFNDFEKARNLYNNLCDEYYKDWGVQIVLSLCEFVDGELTSKFEVAYTEY